jgi:hypothetical protein
VGCQNSATVFDQSFYAARWYSLMRPPGTGRRSIGFWERLAAGCGAGRAQLAVAMGWSCVVVPGVPGKDAAQVRFTEDQHPVGDFGAGGEHEPFGMGVGARTWGRDRHCADTGDGMDHVEGFGELPGAVPKELIRVFLFFSNRLKRSGLSCRIRSYLAPPCQHGR